MSEAHVGQKQLARSGQLNLRSGRRADFPSGDKGGDVPIDGGRTS